MSCFFDGTCVCHIFKRQALGQIVFKKKPAMKKLLFIAVILALTSCIGYKEIPISNISVGMSKSEVDEIFVEILNEKIESRKEENGTVDIYHYKQNGFNGLQKLYALHFQNDELIKWEKLRIPHVKTALNSK